MKGKILVTAPVNPDLDGLACLYAYARLLEIQGKTAVGGVYGKPHAEAKYLIDRFRIDDIIRDPRGPFDGFVLVDASDMAGLPKVVRPDDVVEVIDHRTFYKARKTFPNAQIQIEEVGAAATLVVERYQNLRIPIDRDSVILLYGAIFSNTLNLRAKITQTKDRQAVEFLSRQIQIPDGLVHVMFEAKTKTTSGRLLEEVEEESRDFTTPEGWRYRIVQLEVLEAEELVRGKLEGILEKLGDDQKDLTYDIIFLNVIDLEEEFNLFVTPDGQSQRVLKEIFGIEFLKGVAKRGGLILRKEIIPLLDDYFNKASKVS